MTTHPQAQRPLLGIFMPRGELDFQGQRFESRQAGFGPRADEPEGLQRLVLSLGTRPFIGTPDEISEELQACVATGLDGVLFTFYDYELDLHRFADQILPQL